MLTVVLTRVKLRSSHLGKNAVSEDRMLVRTFGLTMDEVIGGWRKLQNKQLRTLH